MTAIHECTELDCPNRHHGPPGPCLTCFEVNNYDPFAPAGVGPDSVPLAIALGLALSEEQLAWWQAYPDGREVTVNRHGNEVALNGLARAALRHRVAVDPLAAALCVCWTGPPPSVRLEPPLPCPPPVEPQVKPQRTWRVTPSRKRPGWLVVIGPKHQPFIDDLKHTLPRWARGFDYDLVAWLVHTPFIAELEAVIARHTLPRAHP